MGKETYQELQAIANDLRQILPKFMECTLRLYEIIGQGQENVQDMPFVENQTETISQQNTENEEPHSIVPNIEVSESYDEDDDYMKLIERRKQLHKELSRQADEEAAMAKSKPKKPSTSDSVTNVVGPFSTLTKKARRQILKQIYEKAEENVKKFMTVGSEDEFKDAVAKEANRLVQVWAEEQSQKNTY